MFVADKIVQLSFQQQKKNDSQSPNLLSTLGDYQSNMMVVKANDLIQKSRYDLTLVEQKIVLSIIAMINSDDTELPLYEFSIQEFASMCGIDATSGKNYANIKKRLKTLSDKSFYVTLPGTETVTLVRWIEKPYINKGSGTIKIKLDNDLKPFLLQLQNYFTQFNITYTLPMKSQYSIRMYELFKSYENLGDITLDLEELKKVMRCEKYVQWTDFKRFVLETALEEINGGTDISVEYSPLKKGRKIVRLRFIIKKLEEEEKKNALKAIQDKLRPSKLNKEMARLEAAGAVIYDDDDPTPALPYLPTKTGTIEYAAGADTARMEKELKLRMDYDSLVLNLSEEQLDALHSVIKILVSMAGKKGKKEVVINGGNKRTFLLLNDIILKYSGMQPWFEAAAFKYADIMKNKENIDNLVAYMEKCVLNDLLFPDMLVNERKKNISKKQDILESNEEYIPMNKTSLA